MRVLLLLGCLMAAASEACGGVVYTIRFQAGDKPELGVHGGKVRGLDFGYDWDLRKSGVTHIQVREPGESKGLYLAYDPKGKARGEGEVSLADDVGAGTQWRVTRTKDEGVELYTIRAESGRYKGWYLCVEAKGQNGKPDKCARGMAEKVAKSYRVFLAEKPKKLPRLTINLISP